MSSSDNKASLRVAEADARDVGRRIARIDPKVAARLGITTGDAVEVISPASKRKTTVLNWPAYQKDNGKELIRIDGYARNKLGIGIGDTVDVRKVEAKPAQSVALAPTEPLRILGAEDYLAGFLQGQLVTKGDTIPLGIMGQRVDLVVISTNPSGPVIIEPSTEVSISEESAKAAAAAKEAGIPAITYEDIGGLRGEVTKVREMIELPLRHPELFRRLGVEAPKGVILHGPPGTGKTLLAKAVANETQANFYSIGGPEIMSKYYGESEERLRNIFEEAQKNAPSIIFIDELDSIAPKREEVSGEVERRVVAQLLSLMDGLTARGKVVVIGATNRINAIDPALRRPGRFDREIEIGVPDRNGRLEVLQIHTRGMPLDKDVNLEKLADISHGFVGADLQALAKEAAMRALRRVLPEIDVSAESIPGEILNKIIVKMQDFMDVVKEMEPSAMREVFVEIPDVQWADVGGLQDVKQELREAVEWPLKYQGLFAYSDATPPKGILLYGPPGTGKTLLAKAAANESEANFISIKGPELLSKWVGESEKGVREIFRKARQAAPCIIFFDEIDAIAPTRGGDFGDSHVTERVISQMLTELDGLEILTNVVVIAATNRPDIVDPALLRPGRFDRLLYVPPPDKESRLQILKIHTKKKPLDKDVNIEQLAGDMNGYTGADIASVASAAVMLALREHVAKYSDAKEAESHAKDLKVKMRHFKEAMTKVRPLSSQELDMYKNIAEKFGMPSRVTGAAYAG
ncbi:AAA family ATPase, CDC48 subfamily [Candidatus Nitrososphaera evergladensis SR1]|uniref:AAA family ATPase, CDC48 subfamily n=1 Tax=Candidatus Nitrososphaera evergladensis SR1 TaxID=1459636 RepID=A0A075MU14_9ARCH|nr:CDC48 family AAA ATPase [Candidatus Nitrososphaera evergladensis]AIF84648.1 AAA family ATPase, CDC48 subfamily [Candidatus Nitrososphaera evergladensis SR1]